MTKQDLLSYNLPEDAVEEILALHQADLATVTQAADEKLSAAAFDNKLDTSIAALKSRNPKVVKALLDVSTLRTSEDPDAAITQALEGLKSENAWMFEDSTPIPPPYAAGTGTVQLWSYDMTDGEKAFRTGLGLSENE